MVARPPEFGEQTDEVLKEFAFGADEIAALRTAKVVRASRPEKQRGPAQSPGLKTVVS